MLFGSVGQTLSMVVLAVVNYLASRNKAGSGDDPGPGVAAVLFLFVFNTFFAVGWLGMVSFEALYQIKKLLTPVDLVVSCGDCPSSHQSTSERLINKR